MDQRRKRKGIAMKYELTEHELKLLSTALAIAKSECLALLMEDLGFSPNWRAGVTDNHKLRKFIGELHLLEVKVDKSLLPQETEDEDIVLISPFGMDGPGGGRP